MSLASDCKMFPHTVDRDQEKTDDSARLELLRSRARHRLTLVSSGYDPSPRMLDAKDVRIDVERTLDRYLRIEYFSAGSISGAGTGSRGAVVPAPDRDAQLWKSTIAVKLSRLDSEHNKSLTRVADLRQSIKSLKPRLTQLEQVLGSPSAAYTIRKCRKQLLDLRDISRAMLSCLESDYLRLSRGGLYREAVVLFYFACSETKEIREYCFGWVDR